MGLKEYIRKRFFEKSPEPKGKKATAKKDQPLTFVIQKHAARRLHYDFRLELDGVLKSWAIPKEPTLDPNVKRLAIHVEDHPLDYAHFEGIIPQGNYGAGKVEIWDHGTYTPLGNVKTRAEAERIFRKEYEEGKLTFVLKGKKLKGTFALIQIKNDPKHWLFMKTKIDHSEEDVEPIPSSAKEDDPLLQCPKKAMPHQIKPMLATLIDKPFDDPDWLFEVKWDGYRAIAEITPDKIEFYSRNFNSFLTSFPQIVKDLKKFKNKIIFDGEVVMLNEEGVPDFHLMQNYLNELSAKGALKYCIFDLIYYKDRDLRELPLVERKKILKELLGSMQEQTPHLLYSDYFLEKGTKVFEAAKKQKLEGIIGKEIQSLYSSTRSSAWVKIKTHLEQEAIIAGFTAPQGGRKRFGALVLGVYKGNELVYIGHTGTGFSDQTLNSVYEQLKPLIVKECPFTKSIPKSKTSVTWVKPKLVAEISFQEWTREGIMRQAVFKGIRIDKTPKEVKKEESKKATEVKKKSKKKPSFNEIATNAEKIYFPEEKYTKADLLHYYEAVSSYILPHVIDRPQTLKRYPDGITGKHFYQKEAPSFVPDWIQTVAIEHSDKTVNYLLIQDLPSLLYEVNLGSIEIHPFASRYQTLDYPDYIVLDLDPVEIHFDYVVKTAQALHKILEDVGIPHYCKTSGKRGLHLYIPLGAKYTFEEAEQFAKLIATIGFQKIPEFTSLVRNPENRKGKVYIDYLQNIKTKSIIAPYSVRAVPHAVVSTPLEWSEVKKGLDPKKFTIANVPARLKKKGDIFKKVLTEKIDLDQSLKQIEKLL